jgi:hypothetical protein
MNTQDVTAQRRTLREMGGEHVTFRHVVMALPAVAVALVWFGSVVESRAERQTAAQLEKSESKVAALRTEVQQALGDMRADIADLKSEVMVSGAEQASRIDKLTDLLLTGAIKVRKQPRGDEQ